MKRLFRRNQQSPDAAESDSGNDAPVSTPDTAAPGSPETPTASPITSGGGARADEGTSEAPADPAPAASSPLEPAGEAAEQATAVHAAVPAATEATSDAEPAPTAPAPPSSGPVAAGGATLPAGSDPEEQPPNRPSFHTRARLRRRLRYLRQAHELGLRDLGGLAFELHRFQRRNDDLVLAKLRALDIVDQELRAIERVLSTHRAVVELHEPGISACQRCGALHGSEARFCPNCGTQFGGPLELAPVISETPPARERPEPGAAPLVPLPEPHAPAAGVPTHQGTLFPAPAPVHGPQQGPTARPSTPGDDATATPPAPGADEADGQQSQDVPRIRAVGPFWEREAERPPRAAGGDPQRRS